MMTGLSRWRRNSWIWGGVVLLVLLAFSRETVAQRVSLVKDIAPGSDSSPFLSTLVPYWERTTISDGSIVFAADDGTNGRELWFSDGTTAGTGLFKDVRPGSEGSDPSHLTAVNGRVFFIANDGTHGEELWVSDGTAEGTRLVQDIHPGADGADFFRCYGSPTVFASMSDRIFFQADNSTHGSELWTSDGTREGTRMVLDIHPGAEGSHRKTGGGGSAMCFTSSTVGFSSARTTGVAGRSCG